jgi:hypothetical protein
MLKYMVLMILVLPVAGKFASNGTDLAITDMISPELIETMADAENG